MPLKRCQADGKPGWKFGDTGKCFTGPNARARAAAQGRAIQVSEQTKDLKIGVDELGGALVVASDHEAEQILNQIPVLEMIPEALKDLNNQRLQRIHDRLHRVWQQIGDNLEGETSEGRLAKDDVFNAHEFVRLEFEERGMKLPQDDEITGVTVQRKGLPIPTWIGERLAEFKDAVLVPAYISVVGSSVSKEKPGDVDVVVRENFDLVTEGWRHSLRLLVRRLLDPKKLGLDLHIVGNAQGPHMADGENFIPVFDLVLRPRESVEFTKILTSSRGDWYLGDDESLTNHAEDQTMAAVEKRDADLLKFIASLGKQAEGIQFVIGRLKGETTTTVQSVLFDKEKWTVARAKKWLKDNRFKSGDLDETPERLRFRQRDPGDFKERSFRTIDAGEQKALEKLHLPTSVRGWNVGETFAAMSDIARKFSQDESNYFQPSESSAVVCGNCRFFLRNEEGAIGSCQVVGGPVAWFGVCDLQIDATAESAAAFALNPAFEGGERVQRAWPILKASKDGKFVVAPILVPEEVDLEGDIISAEEIEMAAHDFMEHFQNVGLMHQRIMANKDVVMVESTILRQDTTIAGHKLKKGTWIGAFRIHNERLQEAVREGKLTGVSIGGSGVRTPVEAGG